MCTAPKPVRPSKSSPRYESEDTRSHAEVMGPYAQAALQDAGVRGEDLDAILTGTGPGPFTGLRAGIVTARALGFAWRCRCTA